MKVLYIIPYQFIPPDSGNKNLLYNLLKGIMPHITCDIILLVDRYQVDIKDAVRREFPHINEIIIFEKPRGLTLHTSRLVKFLKGFHPALGRYNNVELRKWLSQNVPTRGYDIIHFDMVHVSPYRDFCRMTPSLLVASDAYSMAALRNANLLSHRPLERLRAKLEERRFRKFEQQKYPTFDIVCTVSESDAKYLQSLVPKAQFRTIGIGLSPEYSEVQIKHMERPENGHIKILCAGSINHNVVADGVIQFLNESFPAIKSKYPNATVTVLGRDPVLKLKACIARTVGARHIDFVDNYAGFLDDDWIYVYPQRCGSGLQTKMQQAMALGLPVVGFEISFGGLGVENGKHCFMCRSIDELTRCVMALAGQRDLRKALGIAASVHVRERFSIERIGQEMLSIYKEVQRGYI